MFTCVFHQAMMTLSARRGTSPCRQASPVVSTILSKSCARRPLPAPLLVGSCLRRLTKLRSHFMPQTNIGQPEPFYGPR